MMRIFGAAFLITGLVACNGVPTVKAQSYDNLAPDDAAQTPYADEDYAPLPDDAEAIETREAPPPLPEYDQPMAPGPDYYWTPGYWAWGPEGYYWVPGDWVEAPWVGAVWTPPYWAFNNDFYLFHAGYWGPHVGFYGGINYGFGYPGRGYYGAYWNRGHLFYNRAVTNVNVSVVPNVYRHDVPRFQSSRTSFNGGHGGINFRPTQQERVVTHERRAPAQAIQMRMAQQARQEHNRTDFTARPVPQANPQEWRVRPEQRPAPQRHEFHPAPHPAPVTPQDQQQRFNRRPDLQNHLELQRQRPAPPAAVPPTPAPQMHQAPRQRPAPPAAVPPTPAPQAGQPSAPHGNRGGEHGRGRGNR